MTSIVKLKEKVNKIIGGKSRYKKTIANEIYRFRYSYIIISIHISYVNTSNHNKNHEILTAAPAFLSSSANAIFSEDAIHRFIFSSLL